MLQSFDGVEQLKVNEIKLFYFPPKHMCQCKQDVMDCGLQFEYMGVSMVNIFREKRQAIILSDITTNNAFIKFGTNQFSHQSRAAILI